MITQPAGAGNIDNRATRKVVVTQTMAVSPERVFAELSDAWMYTGWVVGASHIRAVDDHWPDVGSRLHHKVGIWPMTISDTTQVMEVDPPHRLVLQARAWPAGEARIELSVQPDPAGSRVTMAEWITNGIGRWLHNPLQNAVLRRRNEESLARLTSIAENRPTAGS
jgi:uncharacterized protein YndB with AHSA1/START domain